MRMIAINVAKSMSTFKRLSLESVSEDFNFSKNAQNRSRNQKMNQTTAYHIPVWLLLLDHWHSRNVVGYQLEQILLKWFHMMLSQ